MKNKFFMIIKGVTIRFSKNLAWESVFMVKRTNFNAMCNL